MKPIHPETQLEVVERLRRRRDMEQRQKRQRRREVTRQQRGPRQERKRLIQTERSQDLIEREIIDRIDTSFVIPEDLLAPLVGYEDLKFEILDTLRSGVRNHFLFEGPPGSGKTLIMMLLESLPGAVTIGPDTSIAGLRQLFERNPTLVLVNELEKFKSQDVLDIILDWLEYGRWVNTMQGRQEILYNDAIFFFAINDRRYLKPKTAEAFLTRVDDFYLREYRKDEFEEVVKIILATRYHRGERLASYVAMVCWDNFGNNVRKAIRIGRQCDSKDRVDKKVATMMRYSKP